MSLGKASIRRAAGAEIKSAAGKNVNTVVLTPMDADEIQVKFLSGTDDEKAPEQKGPIQLTQKMPNYLL